MKVNEVFDPHGTYDASAPKNRAHAEADQKTGFWGVQGAGCLFLARDTGRLLIAHRSSQVNEPNTWGTWGGAIDAGLSPVEAMKHEAFQECGYSGPLHIDPLLVFKKGTFTYFNFLSTVDREFEPTLDWENQGWRWIDWGEWPQPLHPGMIALLADDASITTIKAAIAKCKAGHAERTDEWISLDLPRRVTAETKNQREVNIVARRGQYNLVVEREGIQFLIKRVLSSNDKNDRFHYVYVIEGPGGATGDLEFETTQRALDFLKKLKKS